METDKYKVKDGIFKGHEFDGYPQTIAGSNRIVDANSEGMSYPIYNVEKILPFDVTNVQTLSDKQINDLAIIFYEQIYGNAKVEMVAITDKGMLIVEYLDKRRKDGFDTMERKHIER